MAKISTAEKEFLAREIQELLKSTQAQNDALRNLILAINREEQRTKRSLGHDTIKPVRNHKTKTIKP